jgi:hypothetical protein
MKSTHRLHQAHRKILTDFAEVRLEWTDTRLLLDVHCNNQTDTTMSASFRRAGGQSMILGQVLPKAPHGVSDCYT